MTHRDTGEVCESDHSEFSIYREYKRKNAKHLLAWLMGERAHQHNILPRPSLQYKLTYEGSSISVCDPRTLLRSEVLNNFECMGIGEKDAKHLACIAHWRGGVSS